MKPLLTELRPAIVATVMIAVLTCGAYPLLVTGIGRAAFQGKAAGSLLRNAEGQVTGSELIGQSFTRAEYFHPRPSAAGAGYDATASSGSNLGPTSQKLRDAVAERIAAYRAANGLAADAPVPADAVTASGSGLDPHISVRNAALQAARVAKARNLAIARVEEVMAAHTERPDLGIFGESRINVLRLNLALDRLP